MSEENDRLVAGIQPVREAIRAHGAALASVIIQSGDSPRLAALARFARDRGVRVTSASRAEIDRLARGAQHQGAVALAPPIALLGLDQVVDSEAAIAVLDGITDPQNFGAAIRSAVALGSGAVIFGEHQAAPLTAATFRASAGAVEHARLCRVPSLRGAVGSLAERGVAVVSLEAEAELSLHELDLRGPVAVVIGSEERGVSRGVRRVAKARARLPMSGKVGSLNASVALAVALYEVRRQREVSRTAESSSPRSAG